MKSKLFFLTIPFFTISSFAQQFSLNFEHNVDYEIASNSFMKMTSGVVKDNEFKDALNSSNKVFEIDYFYGGEIWDYVGFQKFDNYKSISLDEANGKIFKIKFLSKRVPTFSLTLRLWKGTEKLDVVKKFQGLKLNTWYEAEFDFSGFENCNINRIDPWFQDGSKPDGDIYLIDDIQQINILASKANSTATTKTK